MQEVIFVTSNKGKVRSLARRINQNKYKIMQEDLEVPEIQASSAVEIATFKAQFAYRQFGQPIIVQDSSFHIKALSGFPGPYIKFINETIGAEGLLKLMEGIEDRQCFFELALVYIDKSGATHTFVNNSESGSIATAVYKGTSKDAWSGLWNIYMPSQSNKTLAEFTTEELSAKEVLDSNKSEFTQFVTWLEKQ